MNESMFGRIFQTRRWRHRFGPSPDPWLLVFAQNASLTNLDPSIMDVRVRLAAKYLLIVVDDLDVVDCRLLWLVDGLCYYLLVGQEPLG